MKKRLSPDDLPQSNDASATPGPECSVGSTGRCNTGIESLYWGMIERPYLHMRVDELDRLFSESPLDEARVHAILSELGYRTTDRALDLKRRLESHLKTAPSASLNSAAAALRQPSSALPPRQAAPAQKNEKQFGRVNKRYRLSRRSRIFDQNQHERKTPRTRSLLMNHPWIPLP
jgi:hypothetical protein